MSNSIVHTSPIPLTKLFPRTPQRIVDLLYQYLSDTIQIFNHLSITYFVFFGTMLGCYRHGGLIPWDDDIDLVIPSDVWRKRRKDIIRELNKKGYKIQEWWFGGFRIYDVKEEKKVDCSMNSGKICSFPFLDIFVLKNVDGLYHFTSELARKEWSQYKDGICSVCDVLPTNKIMFGNIVVDTPRNAEFILSQLYGKDWKTVAMNGYDHYNMTTAIDGSYYLHDCDYVCLLPNT